MIELAKAIRELRKELEEAIRAAEDEALRFELGPVELEVSVAIERAGQADGKVRFWVVESGAHATVSAASTQHIKLVLQPVLTGSSHPPLIAGLADPYER